MLEKEQKNKAIYYEMALYQWQGQKDLVSPAGSVGASALRAESPPETRTPQHAPRASESKSFYSMPKQKRSPFGNRFRFGRGRRT